MISRYLRVKYEDLMDPNHGLSVLSAIYDFMGISYNRTVLKRRAERVLRGQEGEDKKDSEEKWKPKNDYYSTKRGADFDPNHWRKDLTTKVRKQKEKLKQLLKIFFLQELSEMQEACEDTIIFLGYPMLDLKKQEQD